MESAEDINDEEAYVEDEPVPSQDVLANEDGVFIQGSYINVVMTYLSNPWIWLFTAIIVYYLIKRLELNSKYYNWKEKREYEADAEHIKKNPDFYRERMEAMERARQKQQEAHDLSARVLAEKEKQKEEERRADKIEQLENLVNGKGYNNKSSKNCVGISDKSGTTSKDKSAKSNFRSDYNPLMGGVGGESRYRPDRRQAGGGG